MGKLMINNQNVTPVIKFDPTEIVGTGQHLVTFYDFDGKVLKRQRVATGGDATAPATPTHQYLTFAEWNNPFTNVQSDIDTGAIYNTTDGKTYLFITLTPVTGLAPTLYFSKSSTSLLTIDWGDGTTSTSTTSGNQTINHVYATAGDYIITVDNSAGGTWTIGQGVSATALFSNTGYQYCLTKLYVGTSTLLGVSALNGHKMLTHTTVNTVPAAGLYDCYSLVHLNAYTLGSSAMRNVYSLKKLCLSNQQTLFDNTVLTSALSLKSIIFGSSFSSIAANAFFFNYNIHTYIFLSTTPPTLANINAFTGISRICKIYVPDASVEAYKAATNWSFYANYIYPLSSKPQSDE